MLTAICSVIFDITQGQKIDAIYPEGSLNEDELSLIAMSSFPDSMSFELTTRNSIRDTSFSFRIPCTHNHRSYLHGYVFCRQRFDETMPRGGEQRSVVVLSQFPLHTALAELSRSIGPICLGSHGFSSRSLDFLFQNQSLLWSPFALWSTCNLEMPTSMHTSTPLDFPDILTQPKSSIAATAELVGPERIVECLVNDIDDTLGIPLCMLSSSLAPAGTPSLSSLLPLVNPCTGLYQDTDIYTPLSCILSQLWLVWELMVLGEPVIVVSPHPACTSSTVCALLSLIAPFPHGNDFRPFFSVHDPSFPFLARGILPNSSTSNNDDDDANTKNKEFPTLLGITNPHLLKALSHWPTIISTGYTPPTQTNVFSSTSSSSSGSEASAAAIDATSPGSQPSQHNTRTSTATTRPLAANASNNNNGIFARLKQGGAAVATTLLLNRSQSPENILLSRPIDSIWSRGFRSHTRPDHALLSNLEGIRGGESDTRRRRRRRAQANSNMLRKHFEELTMALMMPLLPYVYSVHPPAWSPSSKTRIDGTDTDTIDDDDDIGGWDPPPLFSLSSFDASAIVSALSTSDSLPRILLDRFQSRKALAEFYSRFLKSKNFSSWLSIHRITKETWDSMKWRHAGGSLKLRGVTSKEDAQKIESYFCREEQYKVARVLETTHKKESFERLQQAFEELPDTIKNILRMSPGRAELLFFAKKEEEGLDANLGDFMENTRIF